MAARKRKEVHKRPAYKLPPLKEQVEDLKKVRAQTIKDLEETKEEKEDWFDKELDKNLKRP